MFDQIERNFSEEELYNFDNFDKDSVAQLKVDSTIQDDHE